MRGTRNRSTLWTFALAFAIVLSPALMQQQDGLGCPPSGETRLEVLTIAGADGEQMDIAFHPDQRLYEVILPEEPGECIIHATPMDRDATVSYALTDGCETVCTGECDENDEFTLEEVPEGHGFLNIWVKAPGRAMNKYVVVLVQPEQCL